MPEHHARFGGSTAGRTMNCPGWRQLADHLPKGDDSSFYADKGTLLHNAMEAIMGDAVEPESVIGMEYNGITLDEALYHEKIVPAMEAVEEIFKIYGIEEWACEEWVHMGREEVGGTGDLMGKGEVWSLVLDYKFGDGIMVSPVENDQFKFYGSAGYHTPETADLFEDTEKVVFAVVQPSDHAEKDYEVWETTIEQVRDYKDRFLLAVDKAEAKNPGYCAGGWCKFCPAAALCPEKTGEAHRALLLDAKQLEDLTAALKMADALEDWIATVRERAHSQLESGATLKGFKLVMKQARRKWIDPEAAMKKLARKLGGKKNVVEEKFLSPAQIEKVAKAQKVDIDLDDMTTKQSSGTALVKASDKRPAVIGGAAAQAALASVQ